MTDLTKSLLHADPRLSRFDPLPRILCYDDFDEGMHGWSPLIGNYENSLSSILPEYRDLRPPMLSNLSMWDTGTAGSMEGTYALKIATRPYAGGLGVGIKRQTFRVRGPLQLECYFCFKPEAAELQLSELDVRAVGVLFDFQDGQQNGELRWMPHLRYLNALNGERMAKWQFKPQTRAFHQIGGSGKTVSHFHLGPEGWEDVPGGHQLLCYNEIATKMNWHYLKVGIDLQARRFTGFQCNDQVYSAEGMQPIEIKAMANLWCMLNVVFFAEADTDKRAFLYLDSVLLSAEL
ncbi:MAG: hypothetical protein IT324_19725 [Anaerolineae bacterium]|nr:hypothetical protein [Anaerolineae bacterium]